MARILVIDDEEPVREMLRQMLERAGHEVLQACDGDEGVAVHKRSQVDLVITDILMPRKGGLVTISELRRDRPDMKIIAMSGGGRTGKLNFLSTAKTFPGVKTLRKPFRQSEVLDAVREILSSP